MHAAAASAAPAAVPPDAGADAELQRLAAAAQAAATVDAATLAWMCTGVMRGVIERAAPAGRGRALVRVLMADDPAAALRVLRDCGALRRLLPEFEALWGVPQLSDAPEPVDVAEHQLRLLQRCAAAGLPAEARIAALLHKLGKAGTPREIWPSHHKHEQRGHAIVETLRGRLALDADAVALAHLVIDEGERVQRASDLRPAAVAALLERAGAWSAPQRFELLLQVCRCDRAACAGHEQTDDPKVARLRQAWAAAATVAVDGLDVETATLRRAEAIARATLARLPREGVPHALLAQAMAPAREISPAPPTAESPRDPFDHGTARG